MVRNVILRCLEPDILGRSIAELVKKGNISVIVTLVSGELVFGDLTLDSQNEYLEFIPQQDRSPKIREYIKHVKPKGGWAIKKDLELNFNARKGQIHGYAKTIRVPKELIAEIREVPWKNKELVSLRVKNYPNPFAKIIHHNNLSISKKYNFEVWDFIECALSKQGIPPTGIEFDKEELIYVDWDYFSKIEGGVSQVGVGLVSVGWQRSLQSFVITEMKNVTLAGIQRFLAGNFRSPVRLRGFLVVPKTVQETRIEGAKCLLYVAATNKHNIRQGEWVAIMIKENSLSYPQEFFARIASEMTFYGEEKQVPVRVDDKSVGKVLMIRAIGYLKD